MKRPSDKERRRQQSALQAARRRRYQALRNGAFNDSGKSRQVKYRGEIIEISETEFQWLAVRGHLRGHALPGDVPRIGDDQWVSLRNDARLGYSDVQGA